MNRTVVGRKDGWTLEEVGRGPGEVTHFRVHPPVWRGDFVIADEERIRSMRIVETAADKVTHELVDLILTDPQVQEELTRRLREQRQIGYFGGLNESLRGEPFDLEGV